MIVPSSPLGANNPVKANFAQLVGTIGRAALNAQFPNDFEYYICSLELVDSQGRTVDFFIFPVMPSSISQTEPKITNIKKTAGGITTLNTTTFQPVDIVIEGNFGRRLRLLLGTSLVDFAGMNHSVQSGDYGQEESGTKIKSPIFNSTIKTGYGCIKILQAIYRKSTGVDDQGNPFKLFFYNPSLGDNFLVKATSFQSHQNKQENMIWNYSLAMKAIAPSTSSGRSDKASLGRTIGAAILGKAANDLAAGIKGQMLNSVSTQLI